MNSVNKYPVKKNIFKLHLIVNLNIYLYDTIIVIKIE